MKVGRQENLSVSLNKSIERSAHHVPAQLDKDNKEISECVYLNKILNNDVKLNDSTLFDSPRRDYNDSAFDRSFDYIYFIKLKREL